MNRRDFLIRSGAAASVGLLSRTPLFAQTPSPAAAAAPSAPATEFKTLRRNVGTFTGRGGTIGWLVNPTGVAAVDTQFPDTAAIFLRDLQGRDGRQLDVVVNTHHHGDHTAGNATFRGAAKAFVAQANVPALMQARAEADKKALDPAVVPETTFAETWRVAVGDETINAKYFGPAHTKGDIVVYFEKANVAHLGDLLFNRIYPVIDRPGGAAIANWIPVLERIAKEYPADTQYMFGHGNPKFGITGTRADLHVFRDYLAALLAHTEKEIKAGKSKEEIQKQENLPGFDDFHLPAGRGNRFAMNLSVAYDELTAK